MLFGKNISMDLAIRVLCVYVCVYAQACACMVACTKTNLNGLNFPFPNTHLTYFAFLSYTRVHTHTHFTHFFCGGVDLPCKLTCIILLPPLQFISNLAQ